MFYILNGAVDVYHKKTASYITELKKDDYFGEIGFFSDLPRQASIKAKDYTECVSLDRTGFLEIANEHFEEEIVSLRLNSSLEIILPNKLLN